MRVVAAVVAALVCACASGRSADSPPCNATTDCSDGIDCTVDMCADDQQSCVNIPHDDLCGAGEVCMATGCAVPPACQQTTDCTDDGLVCNGAPQCMDHACVNVALDCADTDA